MKTTALAHANIALVKYWGKRDARLNLPAVGSISLTLAALHTRTTVEFRTDLPGDRLFLNGRPAAPQAEQRVSRFLDIIRGQTNAASFAEIHSENNFPTGAGLASSASGFAALAVAATGAAQLSLSPTELSALARRGSGSAARSIYGGLVEMKTGREADGSDAVAVPLYDEHYWPLDMLIVITSAAEKDIGSTEGMNRTAETSPYYPAWVSSAEEDLREVRDALARKDFSKLGEIAEYSCFKMHGLALSARPALLYWNAQTVTLIHEVRRLRRQGIPAYVTIDAGPQIKIICQPEHSARIRNELSGLPGIETILQSAPGPGAQVIDTPVSPAVNSQNE